MRQATFTQKNPPRERDDLEVSLHQWATHAPSSSPSLS